MKPLIGLLSLLLCAVNVGAQSQSVSAYAITDQKSAAFGALQEGIVFSNADTIVGFAQRGDVSGNSTNHARGWSSIFTVKDSITYDMLAGNITNAGTGETGILIAGNTITNGGYGWGLDLLNTVPSSAVNGNLTQTTGARFLLLRNVAATGTGFDRGVTVENGGTVQGRGAAFSGLGYETGLQLLEGPGGDIKQYLYFRGNDNLNILRARKSNVSDLALKTQGQSFVITSGDPAISATASLVVTGSLSTGIGATIERPTDNGIILRLGNNGLFFFDFTRNGGTGALSLQGSQSGYNNILLAPTSGNVGIGTLTPAAKLQVTNGDIAVSSQGSGVILKATNGANCYRLTVDNSGALVTALIACP